MKITKRFETIVNVNGIDIMIIAGIDINNVVMDLKQFDDYRI